MMAAMQIQPSGGSDPDFVAMSETKGLGHSKTVIASAAEPARRGC